LAKEKCNNLGKRENIHYHWEMDIS